MHPITRNGNAIPLYPSQSDVEDTVHLGHPLLKEVLLSIFQGTLVVSKLIRRINWRMSAEGLFGKLWMRRQWNMDWLQLAAL
jgi:hypothetical protein